MMSYTDTFLIGLVGFFREAGLFLFLALVLVIADLKFGLEASRRRGEAIKRSRAVRRTLDKVSSYTLWIVVAYVFGEAFGKPLGVNAIPHSILLVIYGVELESIFVNYFSRSGKNWRLNVFKLFAREDIIERGVAEEEKKDEGGAQ